MAHVSQVGKRTQLRGFRVCKQQAAPVPPAPDAKSQLLIAAAWFFPSLGALAALLGFVAESAQQSLLGLDYGDLGVRAYVWAAIRLLNDLAAIAINNPFETDLYQFTFNSENALLIASFLLLGATLILPYLRSSFTPQRHARHVALIVFSLLVLSIWRAYVHDIPAARVINMLQSGSHFTGRLLKPRLDSSAIEKNILLRAQAHYAKIACQHSTTSTSISEAPDCKQKADFYTMASQKIFLASLALSLIFIAISLCISRSTSVAITAIVLAPLALYALVAPAFIYGKFIKSTEYEYAFFQVKAKMLMPLYHTSIPVEKKDQDVDHIVQGILLTNKDGLLTLYSQETVGCGGMDIYPRILWRLAASEVLTMRRIETKNVIEERLKQPECPNSNDLPLKIVLTKEP